MSPLSRLVRSTRPSEEGSAMIIAITVVMIAAMLSLAVISNSLHQLNGVAQTNQQVETVHSAEGGVDLAVSQMQTATALTGLPCGIPGSLATGPITATYTVSVTYYTASGTQMTCPTASPTSTTYLSTSGANSGLTPATAIINSQGGSNSKAYGDQSIQAEVRLTSVATTGAFFQGAIYSNSNIYFNNQTTIDSSTGAANVYSDGYFNCNNQTAIQGNLLANGYIYLNNPCNITGDVESNGYFSDNNGSSIGGYITAAGTGYCSGTYHVCFNNSHGVVSGSVTSSGTVSKVNGEQTGTVTQNSSTVQPPVIPAFDQYNYNSTDWTGYTVITETNNNCAQGETDVENAGNDTASTVIYVPGTCVLSFNNNVTLALTHNLIIFAEGGIYFNNQLTVTAPNATSANPAELYMVVPYAKGNGGSGGAQTCSGSGNNIAPYIQLNNNVSLPTNYFYTFFYTPCEIYVNNALTFAGQIYAGYVNFNNSINMTYVAPSLPNQGGASNGSNIFNISLLYDRQETP